MYERYLLMGGPADGRVLTLRKGLDVVRVPLPLPPVVITAETVETVLRPDPGDVQVVEYHRGQDCYPH